MKQYLKQQPLFSLLLSLGARMGIILFWFVLIGGGLFLLSRFSWWSGKDSLNVLAWGGQIDSRTVSEFYRKTGIRVNISYYTSNEELFVMLRATKGRGYDIIMPSDYAVPVLINEKLIKKIEHDKITACARLQPLFTDHPYDPGNKYTLPYSWDVMGFGYRRDYFKRSLEHSDWGMIFRDPGTYRTTMVNDPIEAVSLAAYYLFDGWRVPLICLTQEQRDLVKQLLITQRKWIEAYTDVRPDYFLVTGNCPLVVSGLAPIMRAQAQDDRIDFTIPHQGTFMSIENLAIPSASTKDELVYKFINYLYDVSVLERAFVTHGLLPACQDTLEHIVLPESVKRILQLSRQEFHKYVRFFAPLLPESALRALWVQVKSLS